ncbi:hypothetical protein P3S67_011725 [Capsicum chacoense]
MVYSPNQEVSTNPSKRCKFFSTTLKDAFANCHIFKDRHSSTQSLEEENAMDDYDDEEEVLIYTQKIFIQVQCIHLSRAEDLLETASLPPRCLYQ